MLSLGLDPALLPVVNVVNSDSAAARLAQLKIIGCGLTGVSWRSTVLRLQLVRLSQALVKRTFSTWSHLTLSICHTSTHHSISRLAIFSPQNHLLQQLVTLHLPVLLGHLP